MAEPRTLSDQRTVAVGQRWRNAKGDTYTVTKVWVKKALFERQTRAFHEKATVWTDRLLADSEWECVDA